MDVHLRDEAPMKRFKVAALLGILGALGLAACVSKPETHTSVGVIRGIGPGGKTVVLEHQAFPDGFMGAMTMTFELEDPAMAAGLKAGDTVQFTLKHEDDAYPVVSLKKLR
jgi:Cu(I)/Ag(I) efflux system protein CusF